VTAERVRVGVICGGASSERQISLATGLEIASHLPRERYEVVLIDPLALMANNPRLDDEQRAQARALLGHSAGPPRATAHLDELPAQMQARIEQASAALVPASEALAADGGDRPIDVAFIAIHGRWGEDGTLQGMLDLLGIPYVGSGVLASALAMDKPMTKTVLAARGLDVPRGFTVERAGAGYDDERALALGDELGYPLVVKPIAQGSSFGVAMVDGRQMLGQAIEAALAYDDRVLVEERLRGTELTVGVIDGDDPAAPVALPVIEIVTRHEFFDYRAKYDPSLTDEICPARIPDELAARAQEVARRAHLALGCRDMSRTDMIATADGRLAVLEVNTIPGMTANSLLPKAARVAGIPFAELCSRLIERALSRGRG
jgi:D-alanine-D-alanine ligase